MYCLFLYNSDFWLLRQSAARCFLPMQLKRNLFSHKIFQSETDYTFLQSADLWFDLSQQTHWTLNWFALKYFWILFVLNVIGFPRVLISKTSNNCGNFHSCHRLSILTRSALIPCNHLKLTWHIRCIFEFVHCFQSLNIS